MRKLEMDEIDEFLSNRVNLAKARLTILYGATQLPDNDSVSPIYMKGRIDAFNKTILFCLTEEEH